MKIKITMHYFKSLYIFFSIVALIISFFSTTKVNANAFQIKDIEVSKPFENNFNKNEVINIGFKKAFFELINTIIKSSDLEKIKDVKLYQIKSMVKTFSIKEEKFIQQRYFVNLGVSFDKKKIYDFLEKKNIFPTQIVKETFLFIPIIIDENINDLLIFSENYIYNDWNNFNKNFQLINYLLPTEDLEDLNLIKSKIDIIENYDFNEIIKKYFLNHSIVCLIFKNDKEIKILSKINIGDKSVLRNDTFKKIDFKNKDETNHLIEKLKTIYDDTWKDFNLINTSIKLPLLIKVDNKNLNISSDFEKNLDSIDLVNDYLINKFDKDFIYYEIIFNGTPTKFINIMEKRNYKFNTQKKIWILK